MKKFRMPIVLILVLSVSALIGWSYAQLSGNPVKFASVFFDIAPERYRINQGIFSADDFLRGASYYGATDYGILSGSFIMTRLSQENNPFVRRVLIFAAANYLKDKSDLVNVCKMLPDYEKVYFINLLSNDTCKTLLKDKDLESLLKGREKIKTVNMDISF